MTAMTAFLESLKAAAEDAEAAERQFRREISARIAGLERERSFAYRRLNLMRAIAEAVAAAEDEEDAAASAVAVLRERLGWETQSEVRTQVLSRFEAVGEAAFRSVARPAEAPPGESARQVGEQPDATPVPQALADFEAWYAGTHQTEFLALFEHYMPDTPRVDF
jgi:hypothetical protein